jgi:hypothetical protein
MNPFYAIFSNVRSLFSSTTSTTVAAALPSATPPSNLQTTSTEVPASSPSAHTTCICECAESGVNRGLQVATLFASPIAIFVAWILVRVARRRAKRLRARNHPAGPYLEAACDIGEGFLLNREVGDGGAGRRSGRKAAEATVRIFDERDEMAETRF